MNKKKVLVISGIIILVILITYLILNPAWFTHPKYMISSNYCEKDSDCRVAYDNCGAVNIYSYSKGLGGQCAWETCGTLCSENNECVLERCS